MEGNIYMNINSNQSGVILANNETFTSTDYFAEWRDNYSQKWVDEYFLGILQYCEEVKPEYDGASTVTFTFMVDTVEANVSVTIDQNHNVIGVFTPVAIEEIESNSVSAELFEIGRRWQELRDAALKTFQTLKFTPCDYRIEIAGMIEGINVGDVTKFQYDFWTNIEDDYDPLEVMREIDEDGEAEIPVPKKAIISDGTNLEIDEIWGCFGVVFDDNKSTVTVYDENDELVWGCNLNSNDLDSCGIHYQLDDPFDVYKFKYKRQFVALIDYQRGEFLKNTFPLTNEFDPKKLSFKFTDFRGQKYITEVSYGIHNIDQVQNTANVNYYGQELIWFKK